MERLHEPLELVRLGIDIGDHVVEPGFRYASGGRDPVRECLRDARRDLGETEQRGPSRASAGVGLHDAAVRIDAEVDLAARLDSGYRQVAGIQREVVDLRVRTKRTACRGERV